MPVTLHQFPYSHYNEKARWALAWKGVDHTKKNYLPGLHSKPIQQFTGRTQTPVLELDGQYYSGSETIIATLEERYPDKPLLPNDPQQLREASELEQRFDHEIGIPARAVLFSVLLKEGTYVAKMFGKPQPLLKRLLYQLIFPMAKGKVSAAYRTDDADYIGRCCGTLDRSLDIIAARTEATGHLVGDSFTVADLSAAALFAPIINPDHPDMKQPDPVPKALIETTRRWREHDGANWVRHMYENFR